jgi:hypothetical protein
MRRSIRCFGLLGMTAFIFSLISMRKEHQFGNPLKGIVWFTLGIVCLCAVVLLADSLAETRNMIEQAVLEEYEKIVAGSR